MTQKICEKLLSCVPNLLKTTQAISLDLVLTVNSSAEERSLKVNFKLKRVFELKIAKCFSVI